jgi:LCP family protein required for cell wall assembly
MNQKGDEFMQGFKRASLAGLIFLLSACSLPGVAPASLPVASIQEELFPLVTAPPDATATATPFNPLPPTPTYLPTSFPDTPAPTDTPSPSPTSTPERISDFPGPSEPPVMAIPPPVGRLPQPEGQINILLLGSDQRTGDAGFRTDTLLLLTIHPDGKTASVTSFPRDLFVYIPGWTMQRINTAQAHGGFETTAMTFEYNLGVRPDRFIMINFWAFVEIIDSLEGIEVDSAAGLQDWRDGYGWYAVPPGKNHMTGEIALWYVRSRMTSNDFERGRRQQEVIMAVFDRLMSLDAVKRAPELFEIYVNNVTTDLQFKDLAPLVPLATKIGDSSSIQHYFIGPEQVSGWLTPTGAQVLLPDRDAVLEVMRQALHSP